MFYPIVYRIEDLENVDETRREKASSGADTESDEWLIWDLLEREFSVLFFDPLTDQGAKNPPTLKLGAPLMGGSPISSQDALHTLMGEIQP